MVLKWKESDTRTPAAWDPAGRLAITRVRPLEPTSYDLWRTDSAIDPLRQFHIIGHAPPIGARPRL
jgi:hypothetical protein